MNTNQNLNIHPSFTTSVNNNNHNNNNNNNNNNHPTWNMASAWPISSTSSCSSSGFLVSDMFGIDFEREGEEEGEEEEELGAMKEMMYKIAVLQPVDIDPTTIRKPKRRNVRISDVPQSVAARHRRERISEKIRILQRLVPGGTKLDTASMLDEAIRYVKFLKRQIRLLQSPQHCNSNIMCATITTAGNNTTLAEWPYTPNTTLPAAASAGLGFNAGDSFSGLNHEVISE